MVVSAYRSNISGVLEYTQLETVERKLKCKHHPILALNKAHELISWLLGVYYTL